MEQNQPILPKKIWSLMRVMFFMLKKGISKANIFTHLNMLIKQGKIAGKSLNNLLFHHHNNWAAATFHRHLTPPSDEYEFSCTTTPTYPLSLFSTHKKTHHRREPHALPCLDNKSHAPSRFDDIIHAPPVGDKSDIFNNVKVMKALEEMLTRAAASPVIGRSPVARQLRVTDSPFPLSNGDGDGKVDEAADRFIMRFYNDLKKQS